VVCQLMGSGLVPRDVIYSFVQANTPIQGDFARRRAPPRARADLLICKHIRRDQLRARLRPHWRWK